MNAKERFYSALARETIHRVTSTKENWTAFLDTMGRNYEFTYPEQIMIFAQRPKASLCKEYDDWNGEAYRRYVRRGSKGIALFVTDSDKPYLRYVFDVADTGTRRSSPALKQWTMQTEYQEPLQAEIERIFGVKSQGALMPQLEAVANRLAGDYWDNYRKQLLDIIENSFLEEYDSYNIEVAFRSAVANSVSYTIYSRCFGNSDDYFEHEDFLNVFDFNTRQTVNALGTAVSSISSQMFQEIERTITEYEQSKSVERSIHDERNDLQTERGLSDSGFETGEYGNEAIGQVREDAESVSSGEQSDAVQRSDSDGAVVSAPDGDRRDSAPQSGIVDEPVSAGESRTGQNGRSDGMGSAHEWAESAGGGSGDGGTYQQLTLNLFLSEEEQIKMIDEAESRQFSAFSFAQEEIDHFLLLGSNTDEARKIIALEYMKQKSAEEIALTLKQVYHGGYGLKEDSGNISAWYAEDGIRLARGSSAIDSPRTQVIPWEDAAKRIGELLENGQFATNVELVEALGFERGQVAQSLWYLYHDLSDHAKEQGFFTSLSEIRSNGFPKETAWMAEQLADPMFLTAIRTEYQDFLKAHDADHSLLRFHYHKLDVLAKRLSELDIPFREYQTDMMQMPVVRQFITDDEINKDLTRGSGFADGKHRIYEYWQENHSVKEKADFLKQEYGTGGHSHACSSATHSGQDHDAKGIRYNKSGCDNVQMSWTQVVRRIDSLMEKGRFLTLEEEAERQAIEDAKANPLEDVYERFAVVDTEDGEYAIWDDQTGDYYVDHEGVTEYFDDEWLANDYLEEVRQSIAAMEPLQPAASVDEHGEPVAELISKESDTEEIQGEISPETTQETKHFIDHFYVAEDIQKQGVLDIKEYSSFEDALRDYYALPSIQMKALGAMNTNPLPGSLDLLHCVDGQDTIVQDYTKVDGWQNPEVMDIIAQIEQSIAIREVPPIPAVNFHISDDHIGEGGPKQKFERNIEAIKTLFQLERENRNAAPEEQEILSNYVGWGGLADAFDPDKGNWAQEYTILKNLLSEDEYAAARASTLNAHYTSPTVIRSIYDAVAQMGFESGNVLEPSMGIGNFFGMLPPEMQSSRLYGVELDSITGRIAQKLYPNADIKVAGFETTDRRDFYDLAVGNVPFGNYKVSDKPYDKLGFSIHNYFFAKTLDQVRPGGVIAFVTSRYTLDSKNQDARKYMAQRAEFLGAIRLPNDAFRKNAGTDVVSDIIFLQKRDHPIDIEQDWVHLNTTSDGFTMNSYFVDHPEMILGEVTEESTQYGKADLTVRSLEGADLAELLSKAVSQIHGSYHALEIGQDGQTENLQNVLPADPNVKNFSYAVVEGEVYFRENSVHAPCRYERKGKRACVWHGGASSDRQRVDCVSA